MIVEEAIAFVQGLDGWEFIFYFWPFFLFDLTRYVSLDLIFIPRYMLRKRALATLHRRARSRLFRERPLVSVIVPGKNEGRHIPALAESLARQTYRNLELVIVDDGSDDNTPHICRKLVSEGKITRFIRNEVRGGKASAANTAYLHSRGKYIVHLDADSHLHIDAIENILLPFFLDPGLGAVGGDIRVSNIETSLATELQTIEYMKSLSTGRTVGSELGILRIISGAFGAFRRDVLDQIGGWDVGPGLDGDLTVKIRKLGYRVTHQPEAACYTNVPDSFLKLARQRYRWDRSLVRFRMRKHRDILLPSASFRFKNFLSSFENITYNFVLDIKWFIYVVQITLFYPHQFAMIFVINYTLYLMANVIEFSVAVALLRRTLRRQEILLFIYLPLMPLYMGFYIRGVRTYAYLMELIHGASYRDRWNPWKVSSIAKKEHL